jgi:acyl-coenzyme A thioesterase PaaI-like protein
MIEKAITHVDAANESLEESFRLRWYEVDEKEIDDSTKERLSVEARDNSLFRGERNPLAPPIRVRIEKDETGQEVIVGELEVNRCREGPEGRVHGGFIAGLFDDVLSGAVRLAGGGPAVTGKLDIRYRKATPLDQELRFEARLENSTGRRIKAKAKCLANGVVTAEAEALFIRIRTD